MQKKIKNKNNQFKQLIGKLHLWFGLLIGSIIFFISITGAMYVFKDEVESIYLDRYKYHNEKNIELKKRLRIKTLENLVQDQVKEKYPLHWVDIPLNKKESYRFHYFEWDQNAWNYFDEFPIYKTVFVNPYTGEVLKVFDDRTSFFNIVKNLHWGFLLKYSWGKYLTGIPVLIFIFMLFSGIILWWPRNRSARKQRIWFRWKNVKSWRRKNYDLHNILGFYSSFFSLIIALTGLFYSFMIIQTLIYDIFSLGKPKPDFSLITTKSAIELRTGSTLDKVAKKVENIYPEAYSYSIDLGNEHLDHHEHNNLEVYVKYLSYAYYKSSALIFDENSGELLHRHDQSEKNMGEKMLSANYDIHVGSILGLPTKVLAFIISLLCASLPVTGFLIWWGKNKKNGSKKNVITKNE